MKTTTVAIPAGFGFELVSTRDTNVRWYKHPHEFSPASVNPTPPGIAIEWDPTGPVLDDSRSRRFIEPRYPAAVITWDAAMWEMPHPEDWQHALRPGPLRTARPGLLPE